MYVMEGVSQDIIPMYYQNLLQDKQWKTESNLLDKLYTVVTYRISISVEWPVGGSRQASSYPNMNALGRPAFGLNL